MFFGLRYNKNFEFFKSANNEFYDSWLPIYINEEHFLKNKITILNSFSIIKYGNKGLKEYDFQPEHIFEIMPNLLSEMIIKMINNNSLISSSYLKCFFQYILLYQKLCQIYKNEYYEYTNNYIKYDLTFNLNKKYRNYKDKIKIVIKFLLLSLFIKDETKKNNTLTVEDNYSLLKKILISNNNKSSDFYDSPISFIKYLNKSELLYKIVINILLNKRFLYSHNLPFNENTIDIIIKKIFINNFEESYNEYNFVLDDDNIFENDSNFYYLFSFRLRRYLSKENIYLYYKCFLIFDIIKNKIYEKNFLNDLEENYGVFLGADDFIKEINQKLKKEKKILDYNKYYGESKNILNEIIFHLCNSKINKTIIALNYLDYKSRYKNIIKAKKNYYENFKFYEYLYNKKDNKKDVFHFYFDCYKSDIEICLIKYKEFKKIFEKENRIIKKNERFNKRKKMKVFKNENKKIYLIKGYKKNNR